jgi:hypothetical protein
MLELFRSTIRLWQARPRVAQLCQSSPLAALAILLPAVASSLAGCPDTCDTLGDSPASDAAPTVLRITNTGSTTIYLEPEAPCSEAAFKFVISDDGGALDTDEYFCGGDNTCDAQKDAGYDGQCEACPEPPIRAIPPGATFETKWDGMHFVAQTIPTSCSYDGEGTIDCVDRRALESGTYQVKVRAFQSCTVDGQPCTCQSADADGTCKLDRVNAYDVTDALSDEVVRDVSFDLPGTGIIEVTFDGT